MLKVRELSKFTFGMPCAKRSKFIPYTKKWPKFVICQKMAMFEKL